MGSAQKPNKKPDQAAHLRPFVGNLRNDMPKGLLFNLTDNLELVDLRGRVFREDKRGSMPPESATHPGSPADRSLALVLSDQAL